MQVLLLGLPSCERVHTVHAWLAVHPGGACGYVLTSHSVMGCNRAACVPHPTISFFISSYCSDLFSGLPTPSARRIVLWPAHPFRSSTSSHEAYLYGRRSADETDTSTLNTASLFCFQIALTLSLLHVASSFHLLTQSCPNPPHTPTPSHQTTHTPTPSHQTIAGPFSSIWISEQK